MSASLNANPTPASVRAPSSMENISSHVVSRLDAALSINKRLNDLLARVRGETQGKPPAGTTPDTPGLVGVIFNGLTAMQHAQDDTHDLLAELEQHI
jgi:hypothetical protein